MLLQYATYCVHVNADNAECLTDISPKDKPWDSHKAQADAVVAIFSRHVDATAYQFENWAQRIDRCAGKLGFAWLTDTETGESKLKLRHAEFCRVRLCPVCQWRRSLMWMARFYQALPGLVEAHPKARWVFLTLTVRNVPIDRLGDWLTAMNAGWKRLSERQEFKPVLGWVRTTEVTRGEDGSAHPHFHVLLMVPSSYFKGSKYVSQARWTELWKDCMRVDYTPVVNVKAVKGNAPDALQTAAAETLKYAVKPHDMIEDDAWLLELARQVHKRRFVATGGLLKDVLGTPEEDNEDLVHVGDDQAEGDEAGTIGFVWKRQSQRYKKD